MSAASEDPVVPAAGSAEEDARATPLLAFHRRHGARLTDFAGFLLPLQYGGGILSEHRACRSSAALFDVSHMGRTDLRGAQAASALSRLLPVRPEALAVGGLRYTFILNEGGGLVDDLILTRLDESAYRLVFNASRKEADRRALSVAVREAGPDAQVAHLDGSTALLALQGPKSPEILSSLAPDAERLRFMGSCAATASIGGAAVPLFVSRCGYTGEDGFEILLSSSSADSFAEALASRGAVPAGLGARDSLRLEAGLPLYGNEMDETVGPLEAGLGWAVPKGLRGGGSFFGSEALARAFAARESGSGPLRARLGLVAEEGPLSRLPARAGAPVFAGAGSDEPVGEVTSGVFSPGLGRAIALARVSSPAAAESRALFEAEVRGRRLPMRACGLPFVAHRYAR